MPRTFYCVGINYLSISRKPPTRRGTVPNVPDRPEIGYRAQNALIAHDEDVVIPATATEKIHYEGELVVVIGKKAKHLQRGRGDVLRVRLDHRQRRQRTHLAESRPRAVARQERRHLQADGAVDRDRRRLDKMETMVRVNGKETDRFRTNDMIFGIAPFIVELTKYFTLWPGDVIWMGTDGASPDIKAGDVVEIEITGIGTLRNRFVKDGAEDP